MNIGSVARVVRITVSTAAAAVITAGAVSAVSFITPLSAWLARIQLLPAAMAMSVGIFALWIAATLLFGRIYCSTVCPMGFFQDVCSGVRRRRIFRYGEPHNRLRYSVLLCVVVCLFAGIATLPLLLDPYSAYTRLFTMSLIAFIPAAAMMALIGWLAWRSGRTWCNTFCPVGAILAIVSRYSVLHFDIDTDRCTRCRRCADRCKARCINVDEGTVDMSRCVVCFNCTAACPNASIRYTVSRKGLSTAMMQRADAIVNPDKSSHSETIP